jgi:predicted GTPase
VISNEFKQLIHDLIIIICKFRTYRIGTHNGYNFQVIDTGGIVFDDTVDIFADRITQQALQGDL